SSEEQAGRIDGGRRGPAQTSHAHQGGTDRSRRVACRGGRYSGLWRSGGARAAANAGLANVVRVAYGAAAVFSRFFIDRPIFASSNSIVITLVGSIALTTLPLAQYPRIAPPTVQVDCQYPGASAQTVMESVAAPIEQQVNGVEDMLYMSSQ